MFKLARVATHVTSEANQHITMTYNAVDISAALEEIDQTRFVLE